jgi:hypothetical protein
MKLKQLLIALLMILAPTTWAAKASHAVSVKYNFGIENNINLTNPAVYSDDRKRKWGTIIKPIDTLQRGGTQGMRRVLRERFPEWRFLTAPPS